MADQVHEYDKRREGNQLLTVDFLLFIISKGLFATEDSPVL